MKTALSGAPKINFKRFVYFSPVTKGKEGRQVLIDPQLLPKFLSLVNVGHTSGQSVVSKIEQLRAIGGGIRSHQHLNNAMLHMDKIENLEVYYKIVQQSGDNSLHPGVYITDINNSSEANGSLPGIYNVIPGHSPKFTQDTFFEYDQAAIGSAKSSQELYDLAEPWVDKGQHGESCKLSLFYIPEALANGFGCWITPEQKTFDSEKASINLAKTLETTQKYRISVKKGTGARLRIVGDGSKLLARALELTKGHMDKLEFQFIDPTVDLPPVLAKLQRVSASLNSRSIISTSRKSQLSLATTLHKVQTQLSTMGRNDDAKQLQGDMANSLAALRLGNAQVHHQNAYFLNAVTQANKLGKWG
ncbi:hypothetical protein [Microbulbifer aggregans]|uniref:hypothetical protein n=1 Tax=Microbulbifer aggregans TaxID=1769779 RepID=UPI001CFC49C0|nr:hypothetical protein [Microbulbifer aggregans]